MVFAKHQNSIPEFARAPVFESQAEVARFRPQTTRATKGGPPKPKPPMPPRLAVAGTQSQGGVWHGIKWLRLACQSDVIRARARMVKLIPV